MIIFKNLMFSDHRNTMFKQVKIDLNVLKDNVSSSVIESSVSNRTKLILFWNDGWGYMRGERSWLYEKLYCPFSCILTTNRSYLDQSSGVVFDGPQYNEKDLPKTRLPWQRWVLFNHETPCYWVYFKYNWTDLYRKWDNVFNWTMTYHLDSDIPMMYGEIRKRKKVQSFNYTESALSRKKDVAWLVSRCWTYSRRELYVQELKKYVDIDIYGGCGNRTEVCKNNDSGDRWLVNKCFRMISRNYKFYLAFENAIADDYLSEKFFRAAQADMVVISRSGVNYTRLGIKPDWFINTSNFESPKALAAYIKKVSVSPYMYAKHIAWKNKYEAVSFRPADRPSFCKLCRKLHDESETPMHHSYADIKRIIYRNACREPKDLRFTFTNHF